MVLKMKVIDPGHLYQLDALDNRDDLAGPEHLVTEPSRLVLRFVKRVGGKYPGNIGPSYGGVTTQEVIRALIDRQKYVNAQRDSPANLTVIRHLRDALVELEMRAADERGDKAARFAIAAMHAPELEPTCVGCGHLLCSRSECRR